MLYRRSPSGFTLIELLIVILIVGVLSALLIPRYWEVGRQARIATLDGVVGAMHSAIHIARINALAQGLRPTDTNPGGSVQNGYEIQMDGFTSEVDWRNLCPESEAEVGDAVSMLDYLQLEENPNPLSDNALIARFNNQYTWVGYNIPDSGPGGCYVRYDSFGNPMCTIDLVIDDC